MVTLSLCRDHVLEEGRFVVRKGLDDELDAMKGVYEVLDTMLTDVGRMVRYDVDHVHDQEMDSMDIHCSVEKFIIVYFVCTSYSYII